MSNEDSVMVIEIEENWLFEVIVLCAGTWWVSEKFQTFRFEKYVLLSVKMIHRTIGKKIPKYNFHIYYQSLYLFIINKHRFLISLNSGKCF